jgi:hypothetical protein
LAALFWWSDLRLTREHVALFVTWSKGVAVLRSIAYEALAGDLGVTAQHARKFYRLDW